MKNTKNHQRYIGINHPSYQLAAQRFTLKELSNDQQLKTKVEILSSFGFKNSFAFKERAEFLRALRKVGRTTLKKAKIRAEEVDYLFLYSGLPLENQAIHRPLEIFDYPVTDIQMALGLSNAVPIAISQRGCSGFFTVIELAANLLSTSSKSNALCITGDMVPKRIGREIMYNVMSDAAAAILLTKTDSPYNELLLFHEIIQPYYHDTQNHEQEILAAYFPLAQRAIEEGLRKSRLTINDIRWIVPHNVSRRSWEILAKVLGSDVQKVWTKNISRIGHTVSCDQIINLADMEEAGVLKKGDYLLLFTFGLGASWSVMIIRH